MFLDLLQWQSPFQRLTQRIPPLLQLGERSAARLRGRGNPASTLVATANARPLPWAAGTSLFTYFSPALRTSGKPRSAARARGRGQPCSSKQTPSLLQPPTQLELSVQNKRSALRAPQGWWCGGRGVVPGHLTQDPGAAWNRGNPRTMPKV